MSDHKTAQQINSPQVGSVEVESEMKERLLASALDPVSMMRELAQVKQQLTDLTACLEWCDKNVWILQKFPKDGWHVAGRDLPFIPTLLQALRAAYENSRDKTKE